MAYRTAHDSRFESGHRQRCERRVGGSVVTGRARRAPRAWRRRHHAAVASHGENPWDDGLSLHVVIRSPRRRHRARDRSSGQVEAVFRVWAELLIMDNGLSIMDIHYPLSTIHYPITSPRT